MAMVRRRSSMRGSPADPGTRATSEAGCGVRRRSRTLRLSSRSCARLGFDVSLCRLASDCRARRESSPACDRAQRPAPGPRAGRRATPGRPRGESCRRRCRWLRSSSSLSWRWVVLAGWITRLLASPTLARCSRAQRLDEALAGRAAALQVEREDGARPLGQILLAPAAGTDCSAGRRSARARPSGAAARNRPRPARWPRGGPCAAAASPGRAGTGTR